MAKSRDAYVDTSALIAFSDKSDSYNSLFRRLFAAPPKLFTSSLVINEGHAWFLRRFDRTRALNFVAMIETMPFLAIANVGKAELNAGTAMLKKFSDQELTIVDAVGLHLMQRHKTHSCWSTDFHLGLTGATLAIHDYSS